MKKSILKRLAIFLLLPILVFVGCKKSDSIPAISITRYFKDDVSISRFNLTESTTDTITLLSQKKANKKNLSKYIKFELKAEPVWMYKMYIEKIVFYVYCNETSEYLLTLNLKMTDLSKEEDILNNTNENVPREDIELQYDVSPKAFKSIKCTFNINRTLNVATGSTITIDILNSLELFSSYGEDQSTFMWLIHGFKVYGESRAYSR